MISYKEDYKIKVYLDKKLTGYINHLPDNKFQYVPLRCPAVLGGEIFDSIIACKQSLEAE